MDLHINPDGEISIDDLIKKHQSDLASQHEFGVEFKGMWVNKEKGMVFCLMEGPDKDACSSVHQKAHGDCGCNIIEVNPGDYDKFLSGSRINKYDIAETEKNLMDSGYRTVLRFETNTPVQKEHADISRIEQLIKKNNGALLIDPKKSIKSVFVFASEALACAKQIKNYFDKNTGYRGYRIAVVSGKPVDENHDEFYGYITDLSEKLSITGLQNKIRTTQLTHDLWCNENGHDFSALSRNDIDIISTADEVFLHELLEVIEANLANASFTASDLASQLHLSRSKLFRKTKQLTNFTPNTLLREIRLYKAIQQLEENAEQISQIAYNSGFNSPSYFTKVFTERFLMLPSHYAARIHS